MNNKLITLFIVLMISNYANHKMISKEPLNQENWKLLFVVTLNAAVWYSKTFMTCFSTMKSVMWRKKRTAASLMSRVWMKDVGPAVVP